MKMKTRREPIKQQPEECLHVMAIEQARSEREVIKDECNYTLSCAFPKLGHCAPSSPLVMTQVKNQVELRVKSGRAGM